MSFDPTSSEIFSGIWVWVNRARRSDRLANLPYANESGSASTRSISWKRFHLGPETVSSLNPGGRAGTEAAPRFSLGLSRRSASSHPARRDSGSHGAARRSLPRNPG